MRQSCFIQCQAQGGIIELRGLLLTPVDSIPNPALEKFLSKPPKFKLGSEAALTC